MGVFPGTIMAVAALPCLLLILLICRFAKNRPKLGKLILKLFALGIMAAIVAALTELASVPLSGLFPPTLVPPAMAFLGIAVPEEAIKTAALLLVVRHRREFEEAVDGLVYGVTLATGFALLENIMYVIGTGEPLKVALIRSFTAFILHALAGGIHGSRPGPVPNRIQRKPRRRPDYGRGNAWRLRLVSHGSETSLRSHLPPSGHRLDHTSHRPAGGPKKRPGHRPGRLIPGFSRSVDINPGSGYLHLHPQRRVEQLAARRAHNPEVAGSSPAPAKMNSRSGNG